MKIDLTTKNVAWLQDQLDKLRNELTEEDQYTALQILAQLRIALRINATKSATNKTAKETFGGATQ